MKRVIDKKNTEVSKMKRRGLIISLVLIVTLLLVTAALSLTTKSDPGVTGQVEVQVVAREMIR